MEDSGKHRFHGLEHDSKIPLCKTYSHTSTLRGHEALEKILEQKTTNEERKTGKGVQNTPANGGIDRRGNTVTLRDFPVFSSSCFLLSVG